MTKPHRRRPTFTPAFRASSGVYWVKDAKGNMIAKYQGLNKGTGGGAQRALARLQKLAELQDKK